MLLTLPTELIRKILGYVGDVRGLHSASVAGNMRLHLITKDYLYAHVSVTHTHQLNSLYLAITRGSGIRVAPKILSLTLQYRPPFPESDTIATQGTTGTLYSALMSAILQELPNLDYLRLDNQQEYLMPCFPTLQDCTFKLRTFIVTASWLREQWVAFVKSQTELEHLVLALSSRGFENGQSTPVFEGTILPRLRILCGPVLCHALLSPTTTDWQLGVGTSAPNEVLAMKTSAARVSSTLNCLIVNHLRRLKEDICDVIFRLSGLRVLIIQYSHFELTKACRNIKHFPILPALPRLKEFQVWCTVNEEDPVAKFQYRYLDLIHRLSTQYPTLLDIELRQERAWLPDEPFKVKCAKEWSVDQVAGPDVRIYREWLIYMSPRTMHEFGNQHAGRCTPV